MPLILVRYLLEDFRQVKIQFCQQLTLNTQYPTYCQHTSPESQEETTPLQEQKYQDGSYVCLDQVSPVYEKSDLEGNEKSVEVHHFESDETSDTMESSSCHESKYSEADISVPESNSDSMPKY